MNNVQIARRKLADAEALVDQAMRDGGNVHGALSGLVAAQEEYEDAKLNHKGSLEFIVKHLLDEYKDSVRVTEGLSAENLIASLCVTFLAMKAKIEGQQNG